MNADAQKAAQRLAELARDPVAAPYLVGYLLGGLDERLWADLVQAALVYRERFGAPSNNLRASLGSTVNAHLDLANGNRCWHAHGDDLSRYTPDL